MGLGVAEPGGRRVSGSCESMYVCVQKLLKLVFRIYFCLI